jgi:hypothetical protein
VILVYDEAFWDEDRDMFGLLNQSSYRNSVDPQCYSSERGRFYLFWNCVKTSGRPVLIALMAGDAAHQTEVARDEDLVRQVRERLTTIYAPKPVPDPAEVVITRWGKDPWARGTYSYVGPNSMPGDYDAMARPLGNLHFAGEATCGTHPATVHGAYLSGLRAASEVIDEIAGPIVVPEPLIPTGVKGEASSHKVKVNAVPQQSPSKPAADNRNDYEKTILDAIFQQIGTRPEQPMKDGTNPFLLYTKDKWAEVKSIVEARKLIGLTVPGKSSKNDDIRAEIGWMWRHASEEAKQPYHEQAEARKRMTTKWMEEWRSNVEKWDREAVKIRGQFTDSKPQFGDLGAQLRAHLDASATTGTQQ